MRLVIPYANAVSDPETHYCLQLLVAIQGLKPEWLLCDHPNAYALHVRSLWAEGKPFVILEHDVFPWPGAVAEVSSCQRPLCGFDGGLQLAKITPDDGPCPVEPRTVWFHVDRELLDHFHRRGVVYHDHAPLRAPIINLNRGNIPR